MTARPKITTQEQVMAALHYDPETGIFTGRRNGRQVGRAGWNGYIAIDLKGRPYLAHRLAWIYMTGAWPVNQIDHKDGDPSNNKFENLREATRFQNMANVKSSGNYNNLPRGVQKRSGKRGYVAQINNGKNRYLGTFDTPEDAGEFYQLASEMLRGEYAFHLSRDAHGITKEKP